MAFSIKLSVKLTPTTLQCFEQVGIDVPWDNVFRVYEFRCAQSPMIIDDLSEQLERAVEFFYYQYGGRDAIQVQALAIVHSRSTKKLPWKDDVCQHLNPGDTIIVDMQAVVQRQPAQYTEQDIEKLRGMLRFGLNDRVLCWVGPRWLSGHIVGTAVVDQDKELLPYVVKTDANPGLPSRTISVPSDTDDICKQEICFDPCAQINLVKAAARSLPGSKKPNLRFAVGDKVVCRIQNSPKDGLENWAPGAINEIWAKLPGDLTWNLGDISGQFPDVVPYKVNMASGGWIYCHWDNHSLIRREGMEPLHRVRGISQRMEVRKAEDGSMEKIDHVTERRKRMFDTALSDD